MATKHHKPKKQQTYTASTRKAGKGSITASSKPPATKPVAAPKPPPAPPKYVLPMPNADDMLAVNDWLTNWQTQNEDIDYGITQQQIDTAYQKQSNDHAAVVNRSAADDAMAARGLIGSSLRDAATYDIEATRALANTYLDNKLSETITSGAARKGQLAASKTNFEAGMKAKYGENAKAINDQLAENYATAMANYKPPHAPKPTTPKPGVAPKPATTAKPTSKPKAPKPANTHQGSGSTRKPKSIATYKPLKPPRPKTPALAAV